MNDSGGRVRQEGRRRSAILLPLLLLTAAAALAADSPHAPEGVYDDRAGLIGEAASIVRARQDSLMRASGCPLFIVTLTSAGGASPGEKAAELFHRWHAEDRVLPDESILLVAFAAEKTGALIPGPAVPGEFEAAFAGLAPPQWDDAAGAGAAIDRFVSDLEAKISSTAEASRRLRQSSFPPVPRTFVLDAEGRLYDTDRARLEKELAALAKSSGHTILAVIDPPGLALVRGDPGGDVNAWAVAAFARWRRERPDLEDGAVLFAFTPKFAAALSCGKNVEGRLPKDVTRDLVRDLADAETSGDFDRTILRVAETLDQRFAGKKTASIHSTWSTVLHPWRIVMGPDARAPMAFKIVSLALFLLGLVWAVWFFITDPKRALLDVAGLALGGVIGGAVSEPVGEAVIEVAGKFLGGSGGSGGGGSSGKW